MSEISDIRKCTKTGGCAAKFGPSELAHLFKNLAPRKNEHLLVGIDTLDDAGVYKLSKDLAQIHTADIITPLTSDPYVFGQIAAANALSDVYAMGGRPVTALNLCFFPDQGIDMDTLNAILQGGLQKTEESGAMLVGGHTVKDAELKYGLSVAGVVNPAKVVRNSGASVGDILILTKPIGSGVHVSAAKRGNLSSEQLECVTRVMASLNKRACEIMVRFQVKGCTDITGFGLALHSLEMAKGSGVGVRIHLDAVPLFPETLRLIRTGEKTSLTEKNQQFALDSVRFDPAIAWEKKMALFDPQTSGGLLIAIREHDAHPLLKRLHDEGEEHAAIIGECFETKKSYIDVIC